MSDYLCDVCGETHDDLPMGYGLVFPEDAYAEGVVRYERDGELCAAGEDRFMVGNIELPVAGDPDARFVWTVWFAVSEASYERIDAAWEGPGREREAPAFAWLWSPIPTYEPTTHRMRAQMFVRELGVRPRVELEPTSHPLAREQRHGISRERIAALYHLSNDVAGDEP